MKISAVVHTYNEEQNIQACLETLNFADEVVVVDNDSTDATVALARAAGARVVNFPGPCGYPEPARVFGLAQLRMDWVFILDADERVSPELQAELLACKDDPNSLAGYWVPIRNYHFGRWLKRGGLYPDWHLRFFRRAAGSYPEVGLHRGVKVQGPTGHLRGHIAHYSYRSIEHYFDKFNTYTTLEARRIIARQRRPNGYALVTKPLHRFCKAYVLQGGFRDGLPGFLFHCFSAAYVFCSELKVWHHYQQQGERLPVLTTLWKRKQ
ncbi:glycosyltransferase family 2 protein [candidate division FCPU426 bacterium]|nr:glycosyltransferase family 2 protein [candidate division FCPU426 bacterium]